MMIRSPPCCDCEFESEMIDAIGSDQPAISHVSRKSRRLRTHDGFTHRRVNAVGANHDVRLSLRAIVESHFDKIVVLRETDATMVEMQNAVGYSG